MQLYLRNDLSFRKTFALILTIYKSIKHFRFIRVKLLAKGLFVFRWSNYIITFYIFLLFDYSILSPIMFVDEQIAGKSFEQLSKKLKSFIVSNQKDGKEEEKKKKKKDHRRHRHPETAVLIGSSSTLVIGISMLFPVPWSLQLLPRNRSSRKQFALSIASPSCVYVKSVPPLSRRHVDNDWSPAKRSSVVRWERTLCLTGGYFRDERQPNLT